MKQTNPRSTCNLGEAATIESGADREGIESRYLVDSWHYMLKLARGEYMQTDVTEKNAGKVKVLAAEQKEKVLKFVERPDRKREPRGDFGKSN